MLWLQKTPNGKAGFRHTWRVKWSPSPGRIGQMVAVRLITIACKMEALLLSSLTKRLSFPALLFSPPPPFLFYRFVCCCSLRWKQKCSMLFEIETECVPLRRRGGRCRQTERAFGSVEPPSWVTIPTPNEVQWRSPGQLTAQMIPLLSTFGKIQTDHIVIL